MARRHPCTSGDWTRSKKAPMRWSRTLSGFRSPWFHDESWQHRAMCFPGLKLSRWQWTQLHRGRGITKMSGECWPRSFIVGELQQMFVEAICASWIPPSTSRFCFWYLTLFKVWSIHDIAWRKTAGTSTSFESIWHWDLQFTTVQFCVQYWLRLALVRLPSHLVTGPCT